MIRLMNNELEGMWKEVIVTQFEVLSQHFPGETEESYEDRQSGSKVFLRYSNLSNIMTMMLLKWIEEN
jgi:hypothetical protein